MEKTIFQLLLYFLFLLTFGNVLAQNSDGTCDFFEEKDGLVVIEMENLPLTESWEVAQAIDGYTGSGYIQWTGDQYFNQTGRGPINFKVKINRPGTYTFNWRVAVGKGTESTEHNDSWLKIKGDHFYAKKGLNDDSLLKPKPNCTVETSFDCPNGSTKNGFFKIFGGNVNNFEWKAKTSDHDAHSILVKFDTAGIYPIEINARSSFHGIDRMILWEMNTQRFVNAERLFNPQSTCLTNLVTSAYKQNQTITFNIYPNPATNQFLIEFGDSEKKHILLKNSLGKMIDHYFTSMSNFRIATSSLPAGVYYLEVRNNTQKAVRKIVIQ